MPPVNDKLYINKITDQVNIPISCIVPYTPHAWIWNNSLFYLLRLGKYYDDSKAQSHFYPLPLTLTPPPGFEGVRGRGKGQKWDWALLSS